MNGEKALACCGSTAKKNATYAQPVGTTSRRRFSGLRVAVQTPNSANAIGEQDTANLASPRAICRSMGLGWDIRTGRNISVTPFWNNSGISTGSETVSFGQIGIGITVD